MCTSLLLLYPLGKREFAHDPVVGQGVKLENVKSRGLKSEEQKQNPRSRCSGGSGAGVAPRAAAHTFFFLSKR